MALLADAMCDPRPRGLARYTRGLCAALLESGAVRPSIHATFPLAEAARAHAMMDAGEQIGKIVLTAGA